MVSHSRRVPYVSKDGPSARARRKNVCFKLSAKWRLWRHRTSLVLVGNVLGKLLLVWHLLSGSGFVISLFSDENTPLLTIPCCCFIYYQRFELFIQQTVGLEGFSVQTHALHSFILYSIQKTKKQFLFIYRIVDLTWDNDLHYNKLFSNFKDFNYVLKLCVRCNIILLKAISSPNRQEYKSDSQAPSFFSIPIRKENSLGKKF